MLDPYHWAQQAQRSDNYTNLYEVIGTAVTMSENCLHGHEIPSGYSKVMIPDWL